MSAPPIAYGWVGRYRACRECGTTAQIEIDDGVCLDCSPLYYGPLGLTGATPRWMREEPAMAMQHPQIRALPDREVPEAWHPQHPHGCTSCGTTTRPHLAKGLCRTCYGRMRAQRPADEGSEEPRVVAPVAPLPPPAVVTPHDTALLAPALRARHAERVTIYRFTCPNCDRQLADPATGKAEYRDVPNDLTLVCVPPSEGGAGCGARWRITMDTLGVEAA